MTEATGERFIPELMPHELIAAEHHARYRLAAQLAPGQRVLDAGCGVGWGTELLVGAGAESAAGVDIAWDAVRDGAQREPQAQFAAADLSNLPFADDSFDLVTCFEAIEHVADPIAALDELARVTRQSGVLLVSSPNPRVYPPGNPFHVHEFTPEALLTEVSARFPTTVLWRQFGFLASVLVEGQPWSSETPVAIESRSTIPDPTGHDPYSLVVATAAPSGELRVGPIGVAMFAPTDQLTNLVARAGELATELTQTKEEAGRARADREHLAARLLETEQRVAVLMHELAVVATARDAEVDAVRASLSWRVTAPLRGVSGVVPSRLRNALRRP